MPNLAQKLNQKEAPIRGSGQVISFPKPLLPQEAIVNTQKNEDGYTPLPNFICDEGYLAVLEGEAVKCLIFLNRHINGFHLSNKGMSETLVKKITGIKDGRTVQKYMSQLAHYQLVRIDKERGKSNVYSLTFEDRLPTQHAGTFNAPTRNAPTSHDGGLPTQHAGGSTHMACGSVKEIDLKENIKINNDNTAPEKFEPQNRPLLQFIEYHTDNFKLFTLRELTQVYPVQSDFIAQAKISFPNLTDEQIQGEIQGLARWSVKPTIRNPQRNPHSWMTTWLNWLKDFENNQSKPKPAAKSNQPKAEKPQRSSRFGQYLKNNSQQPQQMRDIQGESHDV